MAGKLLTTKQQEHISKVLTSLIATLDAGHVSWTKKNTDDIQLAYRMLGMPCPFSVEPDKSADAEPNGLLQRAKAALAKPIFGARA